MWTIGYGSTCDAKGDPVTKNTAPISQKQASSLLQRDLAARELYCTQQLKNEVTQNQFDAIMSLTYNIGIGGFKSSALLRRINAGEPVVERNFTDWSKVKGKVVPGLVRRRKAEYALYSAK